MKNNTSLAYFGLIVLAVVTTVVSAVVNGYALSVLWGWFVVPLFNAPSLSIATAIGLSLAVGMFQNNRGGSDGKEKDTTELIGFIIGMAVVSPLFTLLIGYIVKSFV